MCGICGIVGAGSKDPGARSTLGAMMLSLAHRGPDAEGMEAGEGYLLGHRRLSVIDIEGGAQPMAAPGGEAVLVYNGEIYNYVELRADLAREGQAFATSSDTEVLLRSYLAHGAGCLDLFNGMFAFAVYDTRTGTLMAARDRFGIKPFYYCVLDDGTFLFASEIKTLLRHPRVRAELDRDSLDDYLTFQLVLGEKTLFSGIRKLEPGCFLVRNRDGDVRIERYWDLDYRVDTHHTEDYFIDTLRELLQDSVKGQLRSDVPLGAYLSGGLDSSSVATLASGLYGDGMQVFTGRFAEGEAYDESRYARVVAESCGCRYHDVVPTAAEFIDALPKLMHFMDEPAAGPGLFPQYAVSKRARESVTVVLGGQGGDEIFGGYARYLIAYLEQCLKGAVFETQDEGAHIVTLQSIVPNLAVLKQYVPMLKSFWREGLFEPMADRYFRLIDRSPDLERIMAPDVWSGYDRQGVFGRFSEVFNHPETKSYFNKMTHFDQSTLLPALLHVEDRVSMAVSLESRVPLLDHRIAELVASMPPAMKFQGGVAKAALKRAMGARLPKAVLGRKDKMGFPVPLSEWWDGPLREFVSDILLGKTSRERGLFDLDGLQWLIHNEARFGRQLWGALCLELWCRAFLDGRADGA